MSENYELKPIYISVPFQSNEESSSSLEATIKPCDAKTFVRPAVILTVCIILMIFSVCLGLHVNKVV